MENSPTAKNPRKTETIDVLKILYQIMWCLGVIGVQKGRFGHQ